MPWKFIAVVSALFSITALGLYLLTAQKGGSAMDSAFSFAQKPGPKPPIDSRVPSSTRTATFAMG